MHTKNTFQRLSSHIRSILQVGLFLCLIVGGTLAVESRVSAANSVPRRMMYNARLLNSGGTAVTTPHKVRFTFWIGADAVPSDLTATGAIRITAPNYAGWTEEQQFTPDANGNFYVEMGSVRPLPGFANLPASTLSNLHLQVEVKPANGGDTAYEILDPHPGNPLVDRSPVLSVPFALNADRLDQRDVGTGSGSIPHLLSGGLLSISTIPKGTKQNSFTIDTDDSAQDSVSLNFGSTLGKVLQYDKIHERFDFNGNVRVQGNLTVGGTVNGVDLSQLSGSGIAMRTVALQPSYPDTAYAGDGTNNVGQLTLQSDVGSGKNSYAWTTSRPVLQDYTIVIRRTVPDGFATWGQDAIRLSYKTSSADAANSSVALALFDSAGVPVPLVGQASQTMTATSWTSTAWGVGGGSWIAGESYAIKITVSAKSGSDVSIGDVKLRMKSL